MLDIYMLYFFMLLTSMYNLYHKYRGIARGMGEFFEYVLTVLDKEEKDTQSEEADPKGNHKPN